MAIVVNGGTIHRRGLQIGQRRDGAFHSRESKTASPVTEAVNITTDITTFGGGSIVADNYTLEDGTEGHRKQLLMTGTGNVVVDYNGTASAVILREPDDYVDMKFKEGKWRVLKNTASAEAVAAGDPHYASHDINHVAQLPVVSGERALGAGDGVVVNGDDTFAIGSFASATGTTAIALGLTAEAGGTNAIAVGKFSSADFENSIAIGQSAETFAIDTVAIGQTAQADGNSGIAIGTESDSGGDLSIAIGGNADALAGWSIAIGSSAQSRGITSESFDGSVVIGANSDTTATDTVIVGESISLLNARHEGCAAIGCGPGALFIPGGTTAQRPTDIASFFSFRMNSSLGLLEFHDGSTWKQLATV